ncbi:hypothetical protein C8Q73DRAFT_524495 [Cubamyces lactineus]|nr:hypothetical protein C8Q73DRAFT_524495 [Cubamyces lactineus]
MRRPAVLIVSPYITIRAATITVAIHLDSCNHYRANSGWRNDAGNCYIPRTTVTLAAVALLDYSAMYTSTSSAAVARAAILILVLQRARARLKLESELELEREAMGTGRGGNAAAAALKHHINWCSRPLDPAGSPDVSLVGPGLSVSMPNSEL